MNIWKKMTGFAPGLSAALVAVCAGSSLGNYQMPVYEAEQVQAAEIKTEQTKSQKKEKEETEEKQSKTGKGSFDLADGVYEGEGTGFAGKIRVAVTIKEKTITAVEILSSGDDAAFFNRAKGVIDKILEDQSLDVDVVSGATYSSRGIISAIKNALTGEKDESQPAGAGASQGAGSTHVAAVEDPAAYKDGTYYGTGTGFAGAITVEVVVSGGKIASVQITKSSDGSSYIQRASGLIANIIASQSTNVDTVSGATYSSVGIIEAVRNALRQAAVSGGGASSSDPASEKQDKTPEIPAGKFPYKDGIYYGTGEGYKGDIRVGIVIEDKTIKHIIVLETSDDESFFGRARKLLTTIQEKQSTEVDGISGATFSSEGLLEAVNQALEEAKKATEGTGDSDPSVPDPGNPEADPEHPQEEPTPEPTEEPEEPVSAGTIYRDGVYSAAVPCLPDEDEDFAAYQLSLQVTVQGDRITGVTGITGDGDPGNAYYIARAAEGTKSFPGIVDRILQSGSPEGIDTVSRATCSSRAILDACRQALETARIP